VPSGIVQDKVEFSLRGLKKITKKISKGGGVEDRSFLGNKAASFQIEGTEESHLVADRR